MKKFADIKNVSLERRRFLQRLVIAGGAGVGMSAALVSRLVQLQVADYGYYSARARDNRLQTVPVPPVRGLIYDRNGVLLARNLPSFNLAITPDKVPRLRATVAALRRLLPITDRDVARFRERASDTPSYRAIPLLTGMSHREVAVFEVNSYRYPGVAVRAGLVRDYPEGRAASHVVGYVGGITAKDLQHINPDLYAGLDQIGRTGVERSFEDELRGTPGSQILEVNAYGRPLHTVKTDAATNGNNLHLTIDVRLQKLAEEALGQFNGAVVAMDPRTGELLAMASKPGYDPSAFAAGLTQREYEKLLKNPDRPLYNRTLQGLFAPGSTIKPFMAFAGLQAGTLTNKTRYYCPGYFVLPGTTRRFHCWKRSGHGWLDMPQAIEQSCDVYFYNVAHELGISRIDDVLPAFGFGRVTGVRLPGELPGLVPNPKWVHGHFGHVWYPGETLNTGIGQGVWQVTPLQLAVATSCIAMKGVSCVPHVARWLADAGSGKTTVVDPHRTVAIRQAHASQWADILNGMEMVTQKRHGTAWAVGHGAPYLIAAKTGTAQVVSLETSRDASGRHPKYRDNALFISFAPAQDPRIAVAVVAEGGAEGASAAAPVARKVMDMYLLGHVAYGHSPSSQA